MQKQGAVSQMLEGFKIVEGGITSAKGFHASGLYCGIKKKRLDLAWCYSEVPANAAGVYTMNQFQAAPLVVTKASIAVEQKLQAILVNSGVANACTGEQGLRDAYAMRQLLAGHFQIKDEYVAVTSTGVIGDLLPMDKITQGIAQITDWQTCTEPHLFEQAIMTTDLVSKRVAVETIIDGKVITIGGAAKGSGMIKPNMATMLGFVTTDAAVDPHSLQAALRQVTDESFNMIAVDGDTSTNDMVLVLANGMAGNDLLTAEHPEWSKFLAALHHVCQELAKKIARDGEGATKLIEVQVSGARNVEVARGIGKTIIMSSLVKTAMFGKDPNWGRIVCAIGYSGQEMDPNKVEVSLGPINVFKKGVPTHFDEAQAVKYLEEEHIQIFVELGLGETQAVAWGCDLTYDYVRINAAYRT